MRIIVDANILFSALIKKGMTMDILSNTLFNIYAPAFIFEEIAKHREEILIKTNRTENELKELTSEILNITKLISKEELEDFIEEAEKLSPDKDDAVYFALALKLNCPIWSNDKRIRNQDKVKIYSTNELFELISK